MSFKYSLVFSVLLFSIFSCSREEKFPPIHFERISTDAVKLKASLVSSEASKKSALENTLGQDKKLSELLQWRQFYVERDERFNLVEFEEEWGIVKRNFQPISETQLMEWIETTGYLMELTGKAIYAEELEDLILKREFEITGETENLLKTYIFTKNVDHIQVNLFVNSEIIYNHTLGGKTKITIETDYPESGKVYLKFEMEERRYIEVFVRIPSWAEGTTVTVKNVKYIAPPGGYCQIAKKWREGDLVEIEFPMENLPKYFKYFPVL